MIEILPTSIHLFYTRVADTADPKRESLYRSVLSPGEIDRADRYRFEKDRLLSLTARALVRYLFSRYYFLSPDFFSFKLNPFGKPSLDPELSPLDGKIIEFNISHTKGVVVCGLSRDHGIGVDVERLDRKTNTFLASRFFSPQETDWISQGPEGKKEDRFLKIWTLKEAYIKAEGKGLSIPLDSFSIDLQGQNIQIKFKGLNDQSRRAKEWQFFTWQPEPPMQVAAAIRAPEPIRVYKYECLPFEWIKPEGCSWATGTGGV